MTVPGTIIPNGTAWPLRISASIGLIVATVLILIHRSLDGQPLTETSYLAPLDGLYSLLLVAVLLALSWAIGHRILSSLAIRWHGELELTVFSLAIGLGTISYLTLGLALARLLYPVVFLALASALAFLLRNELAEVLVRGQMTWRAVRKLAGARGGIAPLIGAFGAMTVLLSVCIALLPPFSYDALLYHLAAPQVFVQQHRFVVLPDVGQANFPFTVEMLYTIGLLFGSATAGAMIHLSCGVLTALAVWSFAARFFDRQVAWFGVAAFATASEVSHWAPVANIDLALTLFQFLALYAVIMWTVRRERATLFLGAVLTGLALGTKYTAAASLVMLVVLIAVNDGRTWCRLRENLGWAAALAVVALAVAAPWYLKNALVFHNPFYPLMATLPLDPVLSALPTSPPPAAPHSSPLLSLLLLPWKLVTTGSNQSLSGRSVFDYLALPLQVYLRGDLETYGRPSLLFLLAPGCLVAWRSPIVRRLALVTAALSVLWALGSQELRYLLPVFPCYALLAGYTVGRLAGIAAQRPFARIALAIPLFVVLLISLTESTLYIAALRPLPVLAGVESRDAFLRREVNVYGAYAFLASTMRPGDRALALMECRSYYARVSMLFDCGSGLPQVIFVGPASPEQSAALLKQESIDYVMLDDRNLIDQTLRDSFQRFASLYLQPVYHEQHVDVYRLAARSGSS
jgi:4-amino-4-deoxy-L-arabinose transferase-like glycosyltransferase